LRVLELLREGRQWNSDEFDQELCRNLTGLLTPERRFVLACLESYAQEEQGVWRLRPEDESETRSQDRGEVETYLVELGQRLGYEVRQGQEVVWAETSGDPSYRFEVFETAALGDLWRARSGSGSQIVSRVAVIPGGRSALVAEKARREARLKDWLAGGGRLLKYRHVRRLAAESTLSRENFQERLNLDPPEHQDPQLPLL
jgi:hypothetical protein